MSSSETGLPEGWEVRRSNTKNLPYYFHPETKDSRWEPPQGTNSAQLKKYMAEHHSSHGISSSTFSSNHEGKIRAAHLLVKHRDSRRPASWREAKITRTVEEAQQAIGQYKDKIDSGEVTLSELATTESDCSSARKGGDLGFFGRGDMQKEFEDAAFSLEPGQMSGVVSTASGLHLIQRLE
jgi:NIMA-interacting peptidyl-prolyl cis-trans isomerase 1